MNGALGKFFKHWLQKKCQSQKIVASILVPSLINTIFRSAILLVLFSKLLENFIPRFCCIRLLQLIPQFMKITLIKFVHDFFTNQNIHNVLQIKLNISYRCSSPADQQHNKRGRANKTVTVSNTYIPLLFMPK